MPTGVYERTPEHLAALSASARNRKKRGKQSNGTGTMRPEHRAELIVRDFVAGRIAKAARDDDIFLARQLLRISEQIKDGCLD